MIGQREKCVVLMFVLKHIGRARSFRGARRLNHASAERRAVLAEAAARDG
jgi:hypothetical protein